LLPDQYDQGQVGEDFCVTILNLHKKRIILKRLA